MPIVIEPPEAPPLPPPSEDASNLWELVYEAMGFHRDDDAATGYQLRALCECLCDPYQDIYDLLREREGQKGWAILFDPDECPARWLPYLAQYVGVEPTPEMGEEQLRLEIKQPSAWRRGQPAAIKLVAQRTLTGSKRVIIRPRTPAPGNHYIRTLLAETPDPERTRRILRENVPAWELLDYEAIAGVALVDLESAWPTSLEELEGEFTTLGEIEDLLPEELP